MLNFLQVSEKVCVDYDYQYCGLNFGARNLSLVCRC